MPSPIVSIYKNEMLHSRIYSELTKYEKDPALNKALTTLSSLEYKHALMWKKIGEQSNIKIKTYEVNPLVVWFFVILKLLFGYGIAIKAMERKEDENVKNFYNPLNKAGIRKEDYEEIQSTVTNELLYETFFIWSYNKLNVSNVRDILYGMNDGLVEILAGVAGFAGLIQDSFITALMGLIMGIAGTVSMTAGAYISSKSQKDLQTSNINKLKDQIKFSKEDILLKLKELFIKRGLSEEESQRVISNLKYDENKILEELSNGYLNFSMTDIENPNETAKTTAISYFVGAIIPILPFLLVHSIIEGILISFVFSAISFSVIGSVMAIISDQKIIKKIMEFLAIGIGAAIGTFLIGFAARMFFHISVM
ncbi:MAG: VIT1/CCC1 transporter family protein [Thermoplasmata archaeon]